MTDIQNLVTENLDVWTSAVQTKSGVGRGNGKKLNLYGIKKLRGLILELAVRGKLVPQDENDEPASVLLEKIAAEKERLIKEKKIKKPKELPAIGEGEKLFELPEGWAWVRISEIGYNWGQKKPDRQFTYIDVGAINKELGFIEEPSILEADKAPSRARKIVKNGTVIYSTVRPYLLNIAVIDKDFNPVPIASTAFAIIHPFCGISASYVYRYLRSPSFIGYVENCQTGIAYPAINDKQFFSGLFPVAPEAEQHRIVAKVDELMALCDQLEQQTKDSITAHKTLVKNLLATLTNSKNAEELTQNWNRISDHFDTLFSTEESIEQLKQTILQLAVMGKLVPQVPNDEPASILLEKIAIEKGRLIKEKKIKKQKELPAIGEDEKPFDLPVGWEWCRIGNASLFTEYGMSEKTLDGIDGVPVLKMGDIQNGKVILGGQKYVYSSVDSLPELYLENGDLLYNRTNSAELVGKTGVFEGTNDTYTFASYLIRIRCYFPSVKPQYLNIFMNSPLFRLTQIVPHLKQQCGQANVNGTIMKNMIVALAPIKEQQRIIIKMDELMTICNALKEKINTQQQNSIQVADSLINNIFNKKTAKRTNGEPATGSIK